MTVTIAILILTGIISYQGLNNYSIVESLKHHPYSEHHKKEYYRLLSSGFVHGSMGHLLINCFVLYMFGSEIENQVFKPIFGEYIGALMFALMYLTAIIAGDIPTLIKHKDNYNYSAVGASGATSAIVLIFCLVAPWSWFIYPPVPAIVFGVGYLIYSQWAQNNKNDNIGHSAHLYGAIYGLAFIIIAKPSIAKLFFDKIMEGPIWPPPFF